MGLNLYLPNIAKQKATVKDYIILILSSDWPLSTQKIYHRIKKRYGIDCTYQAVFKAVNELMHMEVIIKEKSAYQINLRWLKHVHSFTETTEANYYTKDRVGLEGVKDSKTEGNISILTFGTMFDVEKYIYYLVKQHIMNSKGSQVICYHHNHEWRPLFYMRAEYNWINKLNELGHAPYILCANSTAIDKFCSRFYKNIGCSIKLNANCASTSELVVVGDLMIEIYLPHDLITLMNKEFSKIANIGAIRPEELINRIFERDNDIQLVIKKDKNIAEQIRKYTLSFFKRRK